MVSPNGVAADACDNIYAVKMDDGIIQITPDGVPSVLADLYPPDELFSAVNCGPGSGGIEEGRMYVMDLGWRVWEVDVGTPGKWELRG